MRMWVLVGVIWVIALLVGAHTTAISDAVPPITDTQFSEPRVDLYGNEISNAVGDYRVDLGGDTYERHAPDTAVLKLGPPGT